MANPTNLPTWGNGPYMMYYTLEGRLSTFKNRAFKLPNAPRCTPKDLAGAGFIFIGTRRIPDAVQCFACGKELSDWEPDDDPWIEHSRKCPTCPFVELRSMNSPTVRNFWDMCLKVATNKIEKRAEIEKLLIKNTFEKFLQG